MHCPQAEKKEDMVPVLDLFYFADWLDWILIFFGSLAGIVTGVAMPAFMYIFGQILDEIGRGKGSLEETVNKLALAMTLIGVVSFVCSTLQGGALLPGVGPPDRAPALHAAPRHPPPGGRLVRHQQRKRAPRRALRVSGGLRQDEDEDMSTKHMMVVLFGSAAVAFQDGTGRRIADACQAFAQFAAASLLVS
jgi:hypothetical protein